MERKRDFKPCVLWVGGDAFVQIVDIKLKNLKSELLLEIKVINKLHFTLTKIEYEVFFYDSSETKINDEVVNVNSDDLSIHQDEISLASSYDISNKFPSARRAEVKIIKAYFDDGKSIELEYENMEKFAINDLDEKDLKLLRKAAGNDAICLPAKLTMNWRCVCGYFNGDESVFCNNCTREKNQVLSDYRSMEYIKEKIERELLSQIDADIEGSPIEIPSEVNIKDEEKEEIKEVVQDEKKEEVSIEPEKKEENVPKKEKVDIKGELRDFFANVNKKLLFVLLMSGIFLASSILIFFSRL